MSVLYFYIFLLVHPIISMMWKIFPKMGEDAWKAFIPLYNYFVWIKLCNQKWYWSLLMLIPGVHIVMLLVFNVSMIRRFGFYGVGDTLQGVFFPYLLFAKISKDEKIHQVEMTDWTSEKQVKHRNAGDHVVLFLALPIVGHVIVTVLSLVGIKPKKSKKSLVKEWGDAILFALVAASVIRTYVFEPFQIPTGSMEKTLVVGDFLFVNKTAYGPKVPVTPFSFPLVHNTIPWVNIRSYASIETLDYTRLPKMPWSDGIQRNDVMVFNYPSGDTAVFDPRMPNGLMGHNYHQILRDEAFYMSGYNIELFNKNKASYFNKARKSINDKRKVFHQGVEFPGMGDGLIYRPVDKRENYIKRCVGLPGDTIEIINKELYINGELAFQAEDMQYKYALKGALYQRYEQGSKPWIRAEKEFQKNFNCSVNELGRNDSNEIEVPLSKSLYNSLKDKMPNLKLESLPKGHYNTMVNNLENGQYRPYYLIFPNDETYDWTEDNFGPYVVPKKGVEVTLTKENIAEYRRVIQAYELHTLEEKADGFYVDGEKTSTYTFQMDYYWLMGDNRNSSADSRFWGPVPEDHVVGKAAMVWFSKNPSKGLFSGGIRTERLFKLIK